MERTVSNFSETQARIVRSTGIVVALVAAVLFVLSLIGRTDLPLYIPLLLLGGASGLLLASRRREV